MNQPDFSSTHIAFRVDSHGASAHSTVLGRAWRNRDGSMDVELLADVAGGTMLLIRERPRVSSPRVGARPPGVPRVEAAIDPVASQLRAPQAPSRPEAEDEDDREENLARRGPYGGGIHIW
jgi:hypothetical protein